MKPREDYVKQRKPKSTVQTSVMLKIEHVAYLRDAHLNLSQMVRDLLDEMMERDGVTKNGGV